VSRDVSLSALGVGLVNEVLPLAQGRRIERAALPYMVGSADLAEGLDAVAEQRLARLAEIVQ